MVNYAVKLKRFFTLVRKVLKVPMTLALQCGFIRRRVAFELKHHWFEDLQISIPLTHDFTCPIPQLDALYSFSEIFAAEEYGDFLQQIALPERWVDLGSHTGYFTLYLAWQHAVRGGSAHWEALLIDADPRVASAVSKMLEANRIEDRCRFLGGAIVRDRGKQEFALRSGMGSSTRMDLAGIEETYAVRSIGQEEIIAALPPPYDLVKIDIEGAEYDFFECYETILQQTAAVLLEWHTFGDMERGDERASRALEKSGFSLAAVLRPERVLNVEGMRVASGVQLYRRHA